MCIIYNVVLVSSDYPVHLNWDPASLTGYRARVTDLSKTDTFLPFGNGLEMSLRPDSDVIQNLAGLARTRWGRDLALMGGRESGGGLGPFISGGSGISFNNAQRYFHGQNKGKRGFLRNYVNANDVGNGFMEVAKNWWKNNSSTIKRGLKYAGKHVLKAQAGMLGDHIKALKEGGIKGLVSSVASGVPLAVGNMVEDLTGGPQEEEEEGEVGENEGSGRTRARKHNAALMTTMALPHFGQRMLPLLTERLEKLHMMGDAITKGDDIQLRKLASDVANNISVGMSFTDESEKVLYDLLEMSFTSLFLAFDFIKKSRWENGSGLKIHETVGGGFLDVIGGILGTVAPMIMQAVAPLAKNVPILGNILNSLAGNQQTGSGWHNEPTHSSLFQNNASACCGQPCAVSPMGYSLVFPAPMGFLCNSGPHPSQVTQLYPGFRSENQNQLKRKAPSSGGGTRKSRKMNQN
jgi:hypothetical protein